MLSEQTLQSIYASIKFENLGGVQNRPDDRFDLVKYDETKLKSIPQITQSMERGAEHSIHLFFSDMVTGKTDITEIRHRIDKYVETVGIINKHVEAYVTAGHFDKMKAPVFALKFVTGYVVVLQCSICMYSNDMLEVVNTTHQFADIFTMAGFVTVREKIGAVVDNIDTINTLTGIPQTAEEMLDSTKYFDYHIGVTRKNKVDDSLLTTDEIDKLECISRTCTRVLNSLVPLSFNAIKNGHQRYLNYRSRGVGSMSSDLNVKLICNEIDKSPTNSTEPMFVVNKVSKEYVWYDTYVNMDEDWIDDLDNPKQSNIKYNSTTSSFKTISDFFATYGLSIVATTAVAIGIVMTIKRK